MHKYLGLLRSVCSARACMIWDCFLINNIHASAILLCLQAYLYIPWESITVWYHGKRTFLIPSIGLYEHQIAFHSITVLLMTYSTLFVKMLCCALPRRFPAWRRFTDGVLPSAFFFLCAYWTVCWKEGSLATVPLLVQKCPQCKFWKVESSCWGTMPNTSFSISRKIETIK